MKTIISPKLFSFLSSLLLFLLISPTLFAQVQIGEDLKKGVKGITVFSPDGSKLAVSNPMYGSVRIYDISTVPFTTLGKPIILQGFMSNFGRTISFSKNGNMVAIGASNAKGNKTGAVLIYKYQNDDWIQFGNTMFGIKENEEFGKKIALSENGNYLAISSTRNDCKLESGGTVQVFLWKDNVYTQIGQNIYGSMTDQLFGTGLAMAADGKTIAISTHRNSDQTCQGVISVFTLENNNWIPKGDRIHAQKGESNMIGFDIDLSDDGNTVATGTSEKGHLAMVYSFIDGSWKNISNGLPIDGGMALSTMVSLSGDGQTLAVARANYKNQGVAYLFKYANNSWSKAKTIIETTDYMLDDIAISNSLDKVVIGLMPRRGNRGAARILKLSR